MSGRPLSVAIWHNLPSGGAKRALTQQVTGLVQRGHRVKVWSPSTAEHTFLDISGTAEQRVLDFKVPKVANWRRLVDPLAGWNTGLDEMRAICAAAATEMETEKYEVLLAHSCQLFVVPPIADKTTLPTLLYHHEPNRGIHEARPELRWVQVRPRSGWPLSRQALSNWRELARVGAGAAHERNAASQYGRLLTHSHFNREAIVRCYGLDATVCYLGIDTRLFCPTASRREQFVMGVGGVEPHKGILLALETVARIISKDYTRRLVWVANKVDHSHVNEVKLAAKALGVDLDLRVQQTEHELVELLGTATAFLCCSNLEPFGLAPLEAMSCGTPVVTIAEGGVREYVEHERNGLTVGQRSADALARELTRLLEAPALVERLGEEARRTAVQRWTVTQAVDRIEGHLHEAVARH